MKIRRQTLMLVASFPALAAIAAAALAQSSEEAYPHREEIQRSVVLDAGAQVRVKGIAGPVTVETVPGNKAALHIVRSGATKADLDCYRISVETGRSAIEIEHVQLRDRSGCRNIRSRQDVRLTLPRSVNVEMTGVAGRVKVGAIDGHVRLSGLAGHTSVAGARSANISGVAGGLSLAIPSAAPSGIQLSGIAGPVELAFARNANADVRLTGSVGPVRSLSPGIHTSRHANGHHIRIGSGGADLSLSSVAGPISIRRN